MSEIENLIGAYEKFVRLPWDHTLAGPQKVWFAIYESSQERRLRLRIDEFGVVTKNAGHSWIPIDLTDAFAVWMSQHEYREAYFAQPELMDIALSDFAEYVGNKVTNELLEPSVDQDTVVAILGLGSLFGLARVSALIKRVAPSIKGRLLCFFPGHHEGSNYRLLDARDGWNYLAVAITAKEGQ